MPHPVVVAIVLFLVAAVASAAAYAYQVEYELEKERKAQGQPEQPELRSASELILNAYALGLDRQASDLSPMNLTGLSYIDLTEAGFDRTYNGSEQSFTMALLKYRGSGSANDDLCLKEHSLREPHLTGNGTIGWMHGGAFYFGPTPDEAFGFCYISPEQSRTEVFMQKGNVLVFVQGIGMEPESVMYIAEMQCDRVHFVPWVPPPGMLF